MSPKTAPSNEIDAALESLRARLEKLKLEYELFLRGETRKEPATERTKVQRELLKLMHGHLPQPRQKFMVQSLSQSLSTWAEHWDRQIRKILESK